MVGWLSSRVLKWDVVALEKYLKWRYCQVVAARIKMKSELKRRGNMGRVWHSVFDLAHGRK